METKYTERTMAASAVRWLVDSAKPGQHAVRQGERVTRYIERLERERDEANARADELAAVLQWLMGWMGDESDRPPHDCSDGDCGVCNAWNRATRALGGSNV